MRSSVAVRAVVFALALCGAPLSAAHAFGDFAQGPWRGEAFFRDAVFTHCGMRANLGAWKLAFTMNERGAVTLGLHNKKLRFTKGNKMQGMVQIDTNAPGEHTFVAVNADTVGIRLGDAAAAARFIAAKRLRIKVGEVLGDFNFAATQRAFSQLSTCVAKRGA